MSSHVFHRGNIPRSNIPLACLHVGAVLGLELWRLVRGGLRQDWPVNLQGVQVRQVWDVWRQILVGSRHPLSLVADFLFSLGL